MDRLVYDLTKGGSRLLGAFCGGEARVGEGRRYPANLANLLLIAEYEYSVAPLNLLSTLELFSRLTSNQPLSRNLATF